MNHDFVLISSKDEVLNHEAYLLNKLWEQLYLDFKPMYVVNGADPKATINKIISIK